MPNSRLSMVLSSELTPYLNVVKEGEFEIPLALIYYKWTWILEDVVCGLAMVPGLPCLAHFEIPLEEFFDKVEYQVLPTP